MIGTCASCGASWLSPDETCPGCGRGEIERSEDPATGEPERYVPFAIGRSEAAARIEAHIGSVHLPTDELDAGLLADRLQAVWWPFWLVDAAVRATWEADVGFDYEVKSSVERYAGGGWTRQEVVETRIRWEPRAGTVGRDYSNIAVPGLADQPRRSRLLGEPTTSGSRLWDPVQAETVALQLPDRTPSEQWPAAVQILRGRVGSDCARAAGAQHFRDLRLALDAEQAAWTWLLLPGWTTWYDDDEGVRRILWVDGSSGAAAGPRMASPAKGRRLAVGLALGASICVGVGAVVGVLGIVLWPLLLVAALLFAVAVGLGIAAIPSVFGPARHNRAELDHAGLNPSG